jgi:uncharacterized membrane protein YjgN (DUF898 family)
MKDYFGFQLKGKQLLTLWIIFYIIIILPYGLMMFKMRTLANQHDLASSRQVLKMFPLFIPIMLAALIWTLYFMKTFIQGISLKESPLQCDYKLGKYLGMVLPGLFLTIITLGIYGPWFMRNVQRFYVNNSSYRDKNFSFPGKGGRLFVIILLTVIIPMILMIVFMLSVGRSYGIDVRNRTASHVIIQQIITMIILIPYIYLVYKWVAELMYNGYHIKWDTSFFPSIGKIFIEIVLTIITVGIYFPMAYLRLYKYFADRTRSNVVENQVIQFGYDIEQTKDFLFIWGQTLLTLITLGIYYPWAICKISRLVLGKTYMEKINNQ